MKCVAAPAPYSIQRTRVQRIACREDNHRERRPPSPLPLDPKEGGRTIRLVLWFSLSGGILWLCDTAVFCFRGFVGGLRLLLPLPPPRPTMMAAFAAALSDGLPWP